MNDPRGYHAASEFPTTLQQYTQWGYTAQFIQLLMDDLSVNTHLRLHMAVSHIMRLIVVVLF
jgi:hypothetical protein